MAEIEPQGVTPEQVAGELKDLLRRQKEDKYAFQVGLADISIAVDRGKLEHLGVRLPFQGVDQAEQALRAGAIQPTRFLEEDSTEHQVEIFDPRPVGFSGFADCVTHSLALTDRGLFEVGRYPAMDLEQKKRDWKWFLHRRLADPAQISEWRREYGLSLQSLVERVVEAVSDRSHPS